VCVVCGDVWVCMCAGVSLGVCVCGCVCMGMCECVCVGVCLLFLLLFINSMLHYHASVILHACLGHLHRNFKLI